MAGDRFSPITPDNHAGQLWIVSILCLVYSIAALAVRAHVKWNLYGIDDAFLCVATAGHIGQAIAGFYALGYGLGKSSPIIAGEKLVDCSEATYSSMMIFIISLYITKASVLSLMSRVFSRDTPALQYFHMIIYVLLMTLGASSVLSASIGCPSKRFLNDPSSRGCASQLSRWQAVSSLDIFSEAILILIPIGMVWPLQMTTGLKIQVILAFAFRIPLIALSLLHLHYMGQAIRRDSSSAPIIFSIIPAMLIQQVQVCWSLLSATIPNLRAFMKSFHSGFGMDMSGANSSYGWASSGSFKATRHRNRGIRLDSLASNEREATTISGGEGRQCLDIDAGTGHLRPSTVRREVVCPGSEQNGGESSYELDTLAARRVGSREMIIRKDVQWSVHY